MRKVLLASVLVFAAACFAADSRVGVVLSARRYSNAEPVSFTITNAGSEPVLLPSTQPWRIVKSGRDVYTPLIPPTITPLNPGETITCTWNQTDGAGQPVHPGKYTVEVVFYDQALNRFTTEGTFGIKGN